MTRGALIDAAPSWSEVQVYAALGAAAGAVLLSVRRQPVAAMCLGAAATAITYQALARHRTALEPGANANHHTRDALGGTRGIHLRESIRLERPVEEVFSYWRQLQNLPRFMQPPRAGKRDRRRLVPLGRPRTSWRPRGMGRGNHQRSPESPDRLAFGAGFRRRVGRLGPVCQVRGTGAVHAGHGAHAVTPPPVGQGRRVPGERCSASPRRQHDARRLAAVQAVSRRQESMRRPTRCEPEAAYDEGGPILRQTRRSGRTAFRIRDLQPARRHREDHLRRQSAAPICTSTTALFRRWSRATS